MSNAAPGYADHPNHRVELSPPEHSLILKRGETTVAETTRAILVEETGYPPRHYIPATDFNEELLESSDSQSYCPFKGKASYWGIVVDGEALADCIWGYDAPYDECQALAGYRGFYADSFDLIIR